jgi:hypothetical protein
MEKTNHELYKEREKRVSDAIALRKPDRVPIVSATEALFCPIRWADDCRGHV